MLACIGRGLLQSKAGTISLNVRPRCYQHVVVFRSDTWHFCRVLDLLVHIGAADIRRVRDLVIEEMAMPEYLYPLDKIDSVYYKVAEG